jgi:hypothetical protein
MNKLKKFEFDKSYTLELLNCLELLAIENSEVKWKENYIQNIINKIIINDKKNINLNDIKFWKKQKETIRFALSINLSNDNEYINESNKIQELIDYFL